LVKSNPSPAYVSRVADAFNNNGNGVRGDMKAVVKAILMDVEARNCSWQTDVTAGKMREPAIRFTQYNKAFNTSNASGRYWFVDLWWLGEELKQSPMHSPSVFNFFQPDFSPNGIINDNNMVAPGLDLILCNGQLNSSTKNIIVSAMNQLVTVWGGIDPEYGVKLCIYYVLSSPDYVIIK